MAHPKPDHEIQHQGWNDDEDQEIDQLERIQRHAPDRIGAQGPLSDEPSAPSLPSLLCSAVHVQFEDVLSMSCFGFAVTTIAGERSRGRKCASRVRQKCATRKD